MNKKLTSFIIIKKLREKEIDMRKIISEFVNEWLIITKICEGKELFSLEQVKNGIKEEFDLDIPLPIIKKILKELKGKKILSFEANNYKVIKEIKKTRIDEKEKIGFTKKEELMTNLKEYIKKELGEEYSIEEISNYLLKYIENEELESKISEIISIFILKEDKERLFDDLKEGYFFYKGLTYYEEKMNNCELDEELYIYLDTEILLSSLGYNEKDQEEEFKNFYDLIVKINKKTKKKIKLRYFKEQKEEIEKIFYVIKRKFYEDFGGKIAFELIRRKAKKPENLLEIQAEFFLELKKMEIIEESEKTEREEKYYLMIESEDKDYIIDWKKKVKEKEEIEKEIYEIYHNIMSVINTKRNGMKERDLKNLKAIFISGDSITNKIGCIEKLKAKEKIAMSVHQEEMLIRLWFNCYSSIGEAFQFVSMENKARIVLQNLLNINMVKSYEELERKFEEGLISEEVMLESKAIFLKQFFDLSEKAIEEISDENMKVKTTNDVIKEIEYKEKEKKELEENNELLENEKQEITEKYDQEKIKNKKLELEVEKYKKIGENIKKYSRIIFVGIVFFVIVIIIYLWIKKINDNRVEYQLNFFSVTGYIATIISIFNIKKIISVTKKFLMGK